MRPLILMAMLVSFLTFGAICSEVSAASASARLSGGSLLITSAPQRVTYRFGNAQQSSAQKGISAILPSAPYISRAVRPSAQLTVSVTDATGSGAGWKIFAKSSPLNGSRGFVLPASSQRISGVTASHTTGSAPVNVAPPTGLSATAATQIFAAKQKTGMGKSTLTFTIELIIPQGAPADVYTGQITITLTSAI